MVLLRKGAKQLHKRVQYGVACSMLAMHVVLSAFLPVVPIETARAELIQNNNNGTLFADFLNSVSGERVIDAIPALLQTDTYVQRVDIYPQILDYVLQLIDEY